MSFSKLISNIFISLNKNLAKSAKKPEPKCQPCPEIPPPFYREKECSCIFLSWKPKSRKCLEAELQLKCKALREKKKEPLRCITPPRKCNPRSFDPFKKRPCEVKEKTKHPVAPPVQIPEADWVFETGVIEEKGGKK